MHHYLRPLIRPESVALVGASERPGSLGRVVFENLRAGGFKGPLYAVNPRHRSVLGQRAYDTLDAIGAPVDLAVIATPPRAVTDVFESAANAKLAIAVVLTAADATNPTAARAWTRDLAAVAKRHRIRMVGPGALGVIRPEIGLDATFCAPSALPGRLALIAQSGAVATAMLDFATPLGIGFSTVISLGEGIDVGFGELLDLLLVDPETDGILLHVEDVRDARRFMSALRAAARTKPVVVLKAGRSLEPTSAVSADAVFDAALRRAGTVRVKTYTQLFAAARILSLGRIPQGDRLAIVSNGRGPALLAADAAADHDLPLAAFAPETAAKLRALLQGDATTDASLIANPIDVRGDAPPGRLAAAAGFALDDPNVDAVIALHVPRPMTHAMDAAQALAVVGHAHRKPLLAAWMGAIHRNDVHAALEAGGVANFYTPENAIDAFSFLTAYRNNQEWLLEVPPPQPEPEPLDLAPLETLRLALVDAGRTTLTAAEAHRVLEAFGIGHYAVVDSLAALKDATGAMRFPVIVEFDADDGATARHVVRIRRSLSKAWTDLQKIGKRAAPSGWTRRIVVREAPREANAPGLAIGVATDRSFGPVICVHPGTSARALAQRRSLMLPPLNVRLAADAVSRAVSERAAHALDAATLDALAGGLIRISALVCALPWVRSLELDPVVVSNGRLFVGSARFDVDPRKKLLRGYPHMAIHPYPVDLIGDVALRDGTTLHVRPIRPEDAELERAFVNDLSEQTRYYRFFYRLTELTPAMLARFTQVDYDRELALVALAAEPGASAQRFVGVGRYIANPDQVSAEFAVVVADAWQRRGVARVLMRGLIVCAKRRGFERLSGSILRVNEPMLAFVRSLGFALDDDPEDAAQVIATLNLA